MAERICGACGRENPPANAFCGGCGEPLARACGACGRANPADHSFCGGCGARLEVAHTAAQPREPQAYTPPHLADRILTARAAIEGERKHVTVMFADVASSVALGESVDPEELHALMDRCFRLILDAVHRYEGTVNQFLGDGVMALFGAPVALEDAPRRAVQAGLDIQRALGGLRDELREERGLDFRMRIGINSGQVVVGRIGDDLRMDYTAVGDTTNLAARLQELARPGTIAISEATARLVAGFFELRDLGVRDIKGKARPVRVHCVEGERPVGGSVEAAAAEGLTPLVGRERELEALHGAFASAREGRGQVVFLVGDPGIGKSRLLYELQGALEQTPHTWVECRCASHARATAFRSLIDGVRRANRIDDRDDDAAALAKLERGVAALGDDLDWTLPLIADLLSLPVTDAGEMDAVTRRSETFRALQLLLMRSAERQPLVFVVEDLHWIDAASEDFLGFLADSIPTARCLLLFTHRPGYQHPFGDRTYHTRLALQPLSAAETTRVAAAQLEASGLPPELQELIASKAEGNPFFIEELTRSLLEERVLRRVDGRVELLRDARDVSIPDRIQDVLMARIDRLAEDSKRAIQLASVIGREFALRLLERIAEAGGRMGSVVGELRALELIYEKASHPELAYMFKHALTHDVAYASVLVERRKALHRIVGSAIEELYRDRLTEHYEALAHHFTQGEDWERALEYHERSADKAERAYANHAAAEHLRQALAVAERLGERVGVERRLALEQRLGGTSFRISAFRSAVDAYLRAAEVAPDPRVRVRALSEATWSALWGHFYDDATEATEKALAAARAAGSASAEAVLLIARSLHRVALHGPHDVIDQWGQRALELAEADGDPGALVRVLTNVALWHEWLGLYRPAIAFGERALEITRAEARTVDSIMPRWPLGVALACVGRHDQALAMLVEALGLCERIGDRALRTRLLNTIGWCYAEVGAHARAREYNERSELLAREMVELELVAAAPELHANAAVNLCGNCIALGDLDGALAQIEAPRALVERGRDAWQRWRYAMHVDDVSARLELARGAPESALALVDRELEAARKHRARKLEARALELRGRVLVAMDEREGADQTLRDALRVARDIEYAPVGWRALSLLGELGRRAGDRAAAERAGSEARSLARDRAAALADPDLRRELQALADRLVEDPLGAYR